MRWNYRLLDRGTVEDPMIGPIEVYYDDDGTICAWCSARPSGINRDDYILDIDLFRNAADKPILTWDDLPDENEAQP